MHGQHWQSLGNYGWETLATIGKLWMGNIVDSWETLVGTDWQPLGNYG